MPLMFIRKKSPATRPSTRKVILQQNLKARTATFHFPRPLRKVFSLLGVVFLSSLTLPAAVLASAGIQTLWWLAVAITLIVRSGKASDQPTGEILRFAQDDKRAVTG
jgi:hypothetical protein